MNTSLLHLHGFVVIEHLIALRKTSLENKFPAQSYNKRRNAETISYFDVVEYTVWLNFTEYKWRQMVCII